MIPRRKPSGSPSLLVDGLAGLVRDPGGDDWVSRFEEAFGNMIGADHCSAVSSGRLGLLLMLKAYQLSEGGEVLMSAYNFHAVPDAVKKAGLTPTFADLDPESFNLSPDEVESRIGPKTVAVLCTHMFGQPCDVEALSDVCKRKGVYLIEDCAHALGAKVGDHHVGTVGDAGFFSFETVKHINTFGGGMVVVKDQDVHQRFREELDSLRQAERLKLARKVVFFALESVMSNGFVFKTTVGPMLSRQHRKGGDGSGLVARYKKLKKKSGDIFYGYTAMQAKVGFKQLEKIETTNDLRRDYAKRLTEAIRDVVPIQSVMDCSLPAFYIFAIRHAQARELVRELFSLGVDATTGFMDYCPPMSGVDEDFPVCRQLQNELIQLPFHPRFSSKAIDRIAEAVQEAASTLGRS